MSGCRTIAFRFGPLCRPKRDANLWGQTQDAKQAWWSPVTLMSSPTVAHVVALLEEGLAQGRMPFLSVTSHSMFPLLQQGDEIGVQTIALEQINVGDVIVVHDESHFTTHRFWGTVQDREQAYLVTRGDRSLSYDAPWPAQQLLGRVTVRRRNGTQLWLDKGRGRLLNRWLTTLARWEERIVAVSGRTAGQGPLHSALHGHVRPPARRSWPRRIIRRAFLVWAQFLTLVVDATT